MLDFCFTRRERWERGWEELQGKELESMEEGRAWRSGRREEIGDADKKSGIRHQA